MHTTTTNHHLDPDDPITPRATNVAGGDTALTLAYEIVLFAPKDYLIRLLRAALDALDDGSTPPEVTERPERRRPLTPVGEAS